MTVRDRLEACPSWLLLERDDEQGRGEVVRVYREIACLPLKDIRDGIAAYVHAERGLLESLDASAKIFCLLRVVFELPNEPVDVSSFRYVDAFRSDEENWLLDRGKEGLLWPLTEAPDGQLLLTGVPVVGRVDFSALLAFDELAERYPRRYKCETP